MLIECPECKKQISSEAISCPGCGYKTLKVNSFLNVVFEKVVTLTKDLFSSKFYVTLKALNSVKPEDPWSERLAKGIVAVPFISIVVVLIGNTIFPNSSTHYKSPAHQTYLQALAFENSGDKKKAAKVYYDAYVQGDVHATYKMGEIKEGAIIKSYEYGTWEDINEAIKFYQIADSLGHPDAAGALRKAMERKRDGEQK